jgi:predicted DNA-binding ribbon-helix-helix protein
MTFACVGASGGGAQERMKSPVRRTVFLDGRKTSVSLEEPFWSALQEIAAERKLTRSMLVSSIARDRGDPHNLSSALRTFVLERYRSGAGSTGSPAQARAKGKESDAAR